MTSGGFLPSIGSLASRASQAARNKIMNRFMPRPPRVPGIPGLPGLPGLPGILGMSRGMPPRGIPGMPTSSTARGVANRLEKQPMFAKIATLVILSLFIGVFFMYIHKKEATFGYDSIQQGLIVACIVIVGIALSFYFKYDMIDFIISSQTNILCFFFLISYSSLTALITPSGFFSHFLDIFSTISDIIVDPTQIFEKGFSLVIPIIFFLIPLIILINNATRNIWLAIMALATGIAVVYVLYPKNNVNPIAGGLGFSTSSGCTKNKLLFWKTQCPDASYWPF